MLGECQSAWAAVAPGAAFSAAAIVRPYAIEVLCSSAQKMSGRLSKLQSAITDPNAAERLIGHFIWEYACHFPNRDSAFQSISGRTPFYMGITLLRIARNTWVAPEHRYRLIAEAVECLRRF